MEHVVLLVLTCPGAVVELERSLIVERVYAGPRGRCYGSFGPLMYRTDHSSRYSQAGRFPVSRKTRLCCERDRGEIRFEGRDPLLCAVRNFA
jgi:hypothetical protein